MADTFADLGIPFPLFEAPVKEAAEYSGVYPCRLCRRTGHCFHLQDGHLVVACPACGADNPLAVRHRRGGECRECRAAVPFPVAADIKELKACYDCLRAGRAALAKDTELGAIAWVNTLAGLTDPGYGPPHPDFETVAVPAEEDDDEDDEWFAARLPADVMFELLRTPDYISWQGETWLFCCRRPMVYLGSWAEADFDRHAPDGDGPAYFLQVIPGVTADMWGDMGHSFSTYVFLCPGCGRHRGHYDSD